MDKCTNLNLSELLPNHQFSLQGLEVPELVRSGRKKRLHNVGKQLVSPTLFCEAVELCLFETLEAKP